MAEPVHTLESVSQQAGVKPEDVLHVASIGGEVDLFDAEQLKSALSDQLGWQLVNKTAAERASGLKTMDPRVTQQCDHACSHCWATLKGGHMSTETFASVLNLAKEAGIESIQFTGGEPTLNKHLIEMAEMAKEQGFNIVLRSHGRHMNKPSPVEGKNWAEATADVFDEIIVSIDGTADANFAMRPVAVKEKGITRLNVLSDRESARAEVAQEQFAETMAGYEALSQAVGNRDDVTLKINTVVGRDNVHDMPDFGKYLSGKVQDGSIRLDEWDMTQVVPAANDTPQDQAAYAISNGEFWKAVTSTALVSENVPKRAKPVTSPRCLIVEKSGRVYVGGDTDIELGSISPEGLDAKGAAGVDDAIKGIAKAIRNYDGDTHISDQRESGYLRYTPQQGAAETGAASEAKSGRGR